MGRVKITPTLLQAIVSSILLLLAPYARGFTPFERIYQEGGVWGISPYSDPLFDLRAALILLGLAASIITVVLFVWKLSGDVKKACSWLIPHFSMTVCALAIGWQLFPFWVNGMYQAYSGNADVVDFDPKALMPSIWMGGLWFLGVLAVALINTTLLPFIVSELIFDWRRIDWKENLVTVVFLVSTMLAYAYGSTNYGAWLFD